ncbi:hypothetical protein D1632_10825 [Chryseobacterium nematophagum]|uniref:Uncharacterized protein n=1 Tax=Chryseobacterium nematophagum TaxID=2305228 RepID=A0A3M7LDF8_9FLAO|nr:hypothetical protein [Chryseobacterium nematophagum]RMZ60074.1 hypothetical protein D1632_10825 [Chryseobacterium nematophagum]
MYSIEDLVKAGKEKVRVTPDLMAAYIELFEKKFGRKPECAGCTFQNDWGKLTQNITIHTTEPMADKIFKLKDSSRIYSYDYKDKKTGRFLRKRRFGYTMEEEFAEQYLIHGSPEQLEKRKVEFKILPEKFQEENSKQSLENISNGPVTEKLVFENGTNEVIHSASHISVTDNSSSLDKDLSLVNDLLLDNKDQGQEPALGNTPVENSEEPPDQESGLKEITRQKSKRSTPHP